MWYCPHCGNLGQRRSRTKGSFVLEVLLWLMLIVPGLIYSLWRLTSREKVCPKCGQAGMIPASSPKARAELAAQPKAPADSGAAYQAGRLLGKLVHGATAKRS